MAAIAPWEGRDLLDVGCGTGFHLPRWAGSSPVPSPRETARSVLGVEPHGGLVAIARRRTARLAQVEVRQGSATDLPVADASIDVVHARWAYFFGPGCEPGLRELDRVVRRGGTAFVIDNDSTRSTFGGWFRRSHPDHDPAAVAAFWLARGWQRHPITTRWAFASRADLEAVVRIEVDAVTADAVLAEHEGTEVDYAVDLWSRTW
jgi:ubiquinone/menaquinone biosynthesis C-methylase UbiE